eukprot:1061565-Pyramimonas_sp.AAC.2
MVSKRPAAAPARLAEDEPVPRPPAELEASLDAAMEAAVAVLDVKEEQEKPNEGCDEEDATAGFGDAASTADETETSKLCCSCNQFWHVDFMKAVNKTKNQLRCTGCHNARSRINRMKKGMGMDSLTSPEPADRHDFMRKAHGALGNDLCALIKDTITVMKTRRITSSMSIGGPFEPLEEAQKRYASNPDMWKSIEQNAQRIKCPIRNCTMIQIPTYESKTEKETIVEESRKREAETEL